MKLRGNAPVPLIKVEDPDISPGLSYATPKQILEVFGTHGMDTDEESSIALAIKLYNAKEEWNEGDDVDVRMCGTGPQWLTKVRVTRKLLMAYNADLQSIEKFATRVITDDTHGYCYKREQRNSIFVACHSVVITEGMVVCCRCAYNSLKKNVHSNEMDVRTQRALKSVIISQNWYYDRSSILRTSTLYLIFTLSIITSSVLIHVEQYEVAVSVLIAGLTLWYDMLPYVAGKGDMSVTFALTFRGSEECVGSHINMSLGKQGRPITDPGPQRKHNHLVRTYVVKDKKTEKSILRFVSATMYTTKMREVLRPTNSCALGSNVDEKTLWDIVMTIRRICRRVCLLTNNFYVVHTASGLKAFEVSSASTTARYTTWKEITEERVGVNERDHVILG